MFIHNIKIYNYYLYYNEAVLNRELTAPEASLESWQDSIDNVHFVVPALEPWLSDLSCRHVDQKYVYNIIENLV